MSAEFVSDFPPVQATQRAGSNRPYEIDVSAVSVAAWQPSIFIEASSLVRPTQANQTGFIYQNAAATAQTGNSEPSWPRAVGGTVVDGSATWTAIVPPASGQDSIASVSWAQVSPPDAALTISTPSHDQLTTMAYIGGGTATQTYPVMASITMASGALYKQLIYVTVT